jgi:dipeptidyl aminopeptidase/acylaminoacyl peptidase
MLNYSQYSKGWRYETSLSPDESRLLLFMYKNKPWELFLADKANPILDQITFSTTENFNAYAWRTPEVINFKAQDGTN